MSLDTPLERALAVVADARHALLVLMSATPDTTELHREARSAWLDLSRTEQRLADARALDMAPTVMP